MNKQPPLKVPAGIRYLTQWSEFCLPDHPCIIDKKLTGCGFTEYVILGDFPACLISPRTSLLKNKVAQHNPTMIIGTDENGNPIEKEIPEERVLYYASAKKEKELGIDKDLESKNPKVSSEDIEIVDPMEFKKNLEAAIQNFYFKGKAPKICVTYDSFKKVKEVLKELGMVDKFYYIVDEFQVIFTDSRFKPNTEIEFVTHLKDLQKVSFVSATPYMEDYLDELDDFKYLPYYELDWKTADISRIVSPELTVKSCKSIVTIAKDYIKKHREGIFDRRVRDKEVIEAKELIFYVNSVKNICDIIRGNKLMPEDVNVICAHTEDNKKKIRESFKEVFKSEGRNIKELPSLEKSLSEVPIPDKRTGIVYNKPITLCTKTVYLGADFYSKCARSIILSDATIESLAVDITLDLPQILGRQRDLDNPWKNSAEIWVRYGSKVGDITQEEFEKRLQEKIRRTESLLLSYDASPTSKTKHDLAEEFENIVKKENYRRHYVAVNHHAGSDLKPQMNQLVMISEKRAFRIQQEDYANRFNVMVAIVNQFGLESVDQDVQLFLSSFEDINRFKDRIKIICNYIQSQPEEIKEKLVQHIPEPFKTYYLTLGPEFIISVCGEKKKIIDAFESRSTLLISSEDDLKKSILDKFKVGEKYTKSQLKNELKYIYEQLEFKRTPKASDIEQWFEVKNIQVINKETGKRDNGYELLSRK